jgi:hypothetical protein
MAESYLNLRDRYMAAGLTHVGQCLTPTATEAYHLLSCLSAILSARQQGLTSQSQMTITAFKQTLTRRLPRDDDAAVRTLRAIVKHAQSAALISMCVSYLACPG